MDKILAWHFTKGMVLRDGQPLVIGKTYIHTGKIKMCESGYHASKRITNALRYAPGAQLSRVRVWGDIQEDGDKLVARNRKVLWTIDATRILHLFACDVAEEALKRIENPDPRSFAAIETKRRWLNGKATDEELSAAWSAAREAWRTALNAARSAALAAESATWRAALAAQSAAVSAARGAVWSGSWSMSWSAYEKKLVAMVESAHKEEG